MIQTNWHALEFTDKLPSTGVGLAREVNFKTAQTVLIPNLAHSRLVLSRIALLSETIAALSNGATVRVEEQDHRVKTRAALSTTLTGTNNDVTLTAVTGGVAGNSITLALVDPSATSQTLAVVVTDTDIVVNLATDGGGAITTTAAQLKTAIEGSAAAAALVTIAFKGADDGTGVVTALAETALAGGLEWTLIQTPVASGDLADSDSDGLSQILTLATGVKPILGGNHLAVIISTGSTATTDTKNILVEGSFI